MKTYTFYLQNGPDEIPAFEIEMFETRDAALAHGRALLADRPRYDRVMVTEEIVEIASFDRAEAVGVAPPPAANAWADEDARAAG